MQSLVRAGKKPDSSTALGLAGLPIQQSNLHITSSGGACADPANNYIGVLVVRSRHPICVADNVRCEGAGTAMIFIYLGGGRSQLWLTLLGLAVTVILNSGFLSNPSAGPAQVRILSSYAYPDGEDLQCCPVLVQ